MLLRYEITRRKIHQLQITLVFKVGSQPPNNSLSQSMQYPTCSPRLFNRELGNALVKLLEEMSKKDFPCNGGSTSCGGASAERYVVIT